MRKYALQYGPIPIVKIRMGLCSPSFPRPPGPIAARQISCSFATAPSVTKKINGTPYVFASIPLAMSSGVAMSVRPRALIPASHALAAPTLAPDAGTSSPANDIIWSSKAMIPK